MNELRVAPEAEAQLDAIWLHVARESGSINTANRIIDSLTDRFWLLAKHPFIGRKRDDLGQRLRSFAVGDYIVIIELRMTKRY
jgi:toxin ParE1/3/4